MPRVKLTEELGKTIKNIRIEKGIKTGDLAKKINKSLAYISKLEKGDFVNIDLDLLIDIFTFLIGEDEDFDTFIDSILGKLSIELTPEEIEKQHWMIIFDYQYRQIPIPKSLIDFIKTKLEELNKTPHDIIDLLNSNEELEDSQIDLKSHKPNSLIINESDGSSFVVFSLNKELLNDILDNKITVINYITIDGIIRTLFKLEGYSTYDAEIKSNELLKSHKFFTLEEKSKLARLNKQKDALDSILTEHDSQNIENIKSILNHIEILSDWNIDYTNRKLINLNKNFNFDPSFTLAILGFNFYKLKHLKKEDKKRFLDDLVELVEKYSKIEYVESNEFDQY